MSALELARLWSKRPDWLDSAACRGMGPDLFFPERGGVTDEAKAVCAECPVSVQCGIAGRDERFGIWGGITGRGRVEQRLNLPIEERRPRAFRPIQHGSANGYMAHFRRGEPACPECLAAHSYAVQVRKRKVVA